MEGGGLLHVLSWRDGPAETGALACMLRMLPAENQGRSEPD
jgi:hypothetical protein